MISGHCVSNLDSPRVGQYDWPTVFAAVPVKGQRVASLDGKHVLWVCGITHREELTRDKQPSGRPYIEVELTSYNPNLSS